MDPAAPTARGGVRTALGVLAAVLLVGLLARSPATEADLGPTDPPVTESAEATPTQDEDPPPAEDEDPPPTPEDTPLRVARLDTTTLEEVQPTLTELAEGWRSSGSTPAVVVEPAGDGGRLRLPDGGDAAAWRAERIDPPADLAWFGAAEGTIAWIRTDGIIRIQAPGSPSANRTMTLPEGLEVRDARLLDAARLAVLTAPSATLSPSLLVLDVEAHVIALEVVLPIAAQPAPRLAHAWDADTLYVADGVAGHLLAVDLARGGLVAADLPIPVRSQRALLGQLTPVLAVGQGMVTVSGVDHRVEVGTRGQTGPRPYGVTTQRPYGIVVFDRALAVRAHVDDGTTTQAHPVAADRILAVSQAGTARLIDRRGQEVGAVVAADPPHPIGSTVIDVLLAAGGDRPAYVVACPTLVQGCTTAGGPAGTLQLLAVDPGNGRVIGARTLGPGFQAFLPDQALLVTR